MKSQKGEPKAYFVGFVGTDVLKFEKVIAVSTVQAKQKFADYHGVRMSSHIIVKRKVPMTVQGLNPIV